MEESRQIDTFIKQY